MRLPAAEPRSTTGLLFLSQYLSGGVMCVSVSRALLRIRWCGIGGFQEQVQCLFVGLVAVYFFVFNYFPFLFFSSIGC